MNNAPKYTPLEEYVALIKKYEELKEAVETFAIADATASEYDRAQAFVKLIRKAGLGKEYLNDEGR